MVFTDGSKVTRESVNSVSAGTAFNIGEGKNRENGLPQEFSITTAESYGIRKVLGIYSLRVIPFPTYALFTLYH